MLTDTRNCSFAVFPINKCVRIIICKTSDSEKKIDFSQSVSIQDARHLKQNKRKLYQYKFEFIGGPFIRADRVKPVTKWI